MKVLILRFSSIGDIVLTTPIIRCLKQQIKDCEVHYLTKPAFKILLSENPYIDQLHLLKPQISETINDLKALKFDYVIDLHKNIRTLTIKTLLGAPSFSFNKLNYKKYLITNFKINRLPAIHIVDRYFETVKPLGVKNDFQGLDYFSPQIAPQTEAAVALTTQSPFISMAIGGQHFTKRMPVNKLYEIVDQINLKIVLLGGKDDIEAANHLEKLAPQKIINLVGKLSLNESAGVVCKSKGLITHDTGMMHIAAALKIPVIAIWGNTIPQFGMTAYYGRHHVFNQNFEVEGLNCRPCSKLGYDKCPKGHFNCMNLQNTLLISQSANSL